MKIFASMLAIAGACLALTISTGAISGTAKPLYQKTAFEQAQAANEHIVVEVFKKGCPTCNAQQPGLKSAAAKYPKAKFVLVDFLGDQDVVTHFKAVKQSTIIVFKGSKEVARLVGETDDAAIVAAIAKGA